LKWILQRRGNGGHRPT